MSDSVNAPLASCVTLSKTFNLSVPPIPNCKMRVIVMVPTLPQEGCEHSANEFVHSIGTVTGTQEVCAERVLTKVILQW